MRPKVIDNDRGDITVEVFGKEVRGWSYKDDAERRVKMVAAHEYAEGWHQGLSLMKERLDIRLNDYLCEMKPDYDDSIVGFNEAWDIVRKIFADAAPATLQRALMADAEKLKQLTGDDHAPEFWGTCPVCHGFGNLDEPRPQHDDRDFCVSIDCAECGGSGWVRCDPVGDNAP